ncbi:MAG: PKD domain-containing protein [Chitinophagaceae bacterium]
MKKIVFLFLLIISCTVGKATHISGGELFYRYVGAGAAANTSRYEITMRLLRECSSPGAPLNGEVVNIGIYNAATLALTNTLTLAQTFTGAPPSIRNTQGTNACLTVFISVCYQVGIYQSTIDLPNTANGYMLSWTRYSRMDLQNSNNPMGAIYTTSIPGTTLIGTTGVNSSPKFIDKDTALVCFSSRFSLDFGAVDADGDSLTYEFCDAFTGGNSADPNPPPSTSLSLPTLSYISPYSGLNPMGNAVTINRKTGIISGRSPAATGPYVLCVCVTEWRNGVAINKHRKDFIVRVGNCNLPSAELQQPGYLNCKSFTNNFENLSTSPSITNYTWSFGQPFRGSLDTSRLPTPTYTYTDTGTFVVRLLISNNFGCTSEDTSVMRVYPGLKANFTATGNCYLNPYVFNSNGSTNTYGPITSYAWDFGQTTITTDTSTQRNTTYTYPNAGNKTVQLIVGNTFGCFDTLANPILVLDKPIINLPFRDTLICSIDTLPLRSNTGPGIISWTPNYNIQSTTINNPFVFPKDTTVYKITVTENGCVNTDSITVNVLDFITVDAGVDTTICATDTITLRPISQALGYLWSPTTAMNNNLIKNPKIAPTSYTKYYVTANLGKCQDRDSVQIFPFPYPQVIASADTTICFGRRTPISATIAADRFVWQPSNSLINATTLNPTAGPSATTNYIITANYNTGCLKPRSDTVTVNVVPLFNVFAGRDTFVVVNQPLQLNALVQDTTGKSFTWIPSSHLNNATIRNPIATLPSSVDSIVYQVTARVMPNCIATDDIKVRVFKTAPDIFVPSAFTPNTDGLNEVLKPIAIGITKIDYFNIFNRWGQLLFTTNEIGKGWNGVFNGTKQPSGTYVYQVQGVDFLGNVITKKGTIVLIR